MISEADKKIFAWLDELCQEARKDVITANRLGNNPAFAYYFNNVYTLKAMSQATFASMQAMTEARRWYDEYHEAEERKAAEDARDGKIAALEGTVNEMKVMLTQFMESQKPAEPPAKKNGKGKAAKDEATEETEE